ncbi:MAG: hypothetical protein OYH77_03930 [Pseudomonadota bacterium]|nr:hypothetical protein [Pseudomonadota bacterium]
MSLASAGKFPESAHLFKFCHRVLTQKRGKRVNDQDVGSILNFNPSDCSHWKRGKKNVRSVFALEKLATELNIEVALIYDIISGAVDIDEAYYEHQQAIEFRRVLAAARQEDPGLLNDVQQRCEQFISELHQRCEYVVPPLYLPEVMLFFPSISTQAVDMVDKLSRILRVKSSQYCIQFRSGDIRPQTRMSVIAELARILLQGERSKYPQLGELNEALLKFEQHLFIAEMLAPKAMLKREMQNVDARKNLISGLAAQFWVPRMLISYQMQSILRSHLAEAVLSQGDQQQPASFSEGARV